MDQFVDVLGKRGPMHLRQIEVGTQVEQGGLLDGIAHSGAVHQSIRDIGLAGDAIAGLGATNEHAEILHEKSSARPEG